MLLSSSKVVTNSGDRFIHKCKMPDVGSVLGFSLKTKDLTWYPLSEILRMPCNIDEVVTICLVDSNKVQRVVLATKAHIVPTLNRGNQHVNDLCSGDRLLGLPQAFYNKSLRGGIENVSPEIFFVKDTFPGVGAIKRFQKQKFTYTLDCENFFTNGILVYNSIKPPIGSKFSKEHFPTSIRRQTLSLPDWGECTLVWLEGTSPKHSCWLILSDQLYTKGDKGGYFLKYKEGRKNYARKVKSLL